MNDEIKEILDNFKIYEDRYKKCNETQFIIFYRDIHLLLDYITNLQHTKEYLGEVLYEKDKELEKLKTKTKEQSLLLIDYQDMEQKLEDYKSRVEKAIEYKHSWQNIEENETIVFDNNKLIDFFNKMENILNGKASDE